MVLTSTINLQLEQLFKMLEPYEMPMQNLPQFKEIECLGFQLSEFNLNFRKNFLEVNCGYKPVQTPSDVELCEKFVDALKNGPKQFMDGATDMFGQQLNKFQPGTKELPDADEAFDIDEVEQQKDTTNDEL